MLSWPTSGFIDDVMFSHHGSMARIKLDVMFRRVRQVALPVGRNYSVWLSLSESGTGASLLSTIALIAICHRRACHCTDDRGQ